jgi:hypothetical protein
MEAFKKYLPWIIVAVIGLFLIRKLSSQSTRLVPQTQFTETQQVDQFAESRASAFNALLQVVGLQIGADTEARRAEIQRELGLKALDVDLSKANLFAQAAEREAARGFQSRENDRQIQQSAIDRYYSSRNTGQIINSVTQALSSIFGNRNRGGVFTPPTFPSSGGFY